MGKMFWVAVGAAGDRATAIAASIRSISSLVPQPRAASRQTIVVPPRDA